MLCDPKVVPATGWHMDGHKRLRQDTDRKQTAVATEAAPVTASVAVPALSAIVAVTTYFPATVAVAVYFPNKPQLPPSLKAQIRL